MALGVSMDRPRLEELRNIATVFQELVESIDMRFCMTLVMYPDLHIWQPLQNGKLYGCWRACETTRTTCRMMTFKDF